MAEIEMKHDSECNFSDDVLKAKDFIEGRLQGNLRRPTLGIICGSGLGGISNEIRQEPRCEIGYGEIPFFPASTVEGHAGKLVFGLLDEIRGPVVLMVGRVHYYEGHPIRALTFPVRVLKRLGIEILIVTNAAGALNPDYAVGDLMVLMDHINLASLAGINPLRGPNAGDFGVRFPALSDAYDLYLRRQIHQTWQMLETSRNSNRRLHEGVYAFVGGPSYETRAECRMLRQLGADVVGMSTVPEVIVARHSGIKVLGLSLVTNKAVLKSGPRGDDPLVQKATAESLVDVITQGKANHEEVLEESAKIASDVQHLISTLAIGIMKP